MSLFDHLFKQETASISDFANYRREQIRDQSVESVSEKSRAKQLMENMAGLYNPVNYFWRTTAASRLERKAFNLVLDAYNYFRE